MLHNLTAAKFFAQPTIYSVFITLYISYF